MLQYGSFCLCKFRPDPPDRGRKSERILWADGQYDVSTTTYTYDVLSRLTAVSNSSMPTATRDTTYTYNANSQLLTETTGDLVTSYEYNDAGLVTVKSSVLPGMNSEDPYVIPAHYEYDYNTNGNQRGKHIPRDRHSILYTYDGAGRLTLESIGGLGYDSQTSYFYDASGNRTRKVCVENPTEQYGTLAIYTTDYVYDANNRLTSVTTGTDTLSYTYDNNGNMLSESNGKTYSYNVLNQLVTFVNGENTTTYTYLPNGLRASKTSGNNENHIHSDFVWDGDDLVYEYVRTQYYYPSLDNCIVYNYGNGLISQSNTETDTYILFATDGHGDVTKLLDATNPNFSDPVDENEFDAFGNGGSIGYHGMGYAGQYHDYETGFIYLRARYYSPAVGRFINEDSHWTIVNMIYGDSPTSIGGRVIPNYNAIAQSTNLYAYCRNNPVLYADANGEFLHVIIGAAVGAVCGAVSGFIEATNGLREFGEIDWGIVGIEALGGATNGALVASGGAAFTPLVAGTKEMSKELYENGGDFTKVNYTNILFETAFELLPGNNPVVNFSHLDTASIQLFKRVGAALTGDMTTDAMRYELKGAIKYYFSQSKSELKQLAKNALKDFVRELPVEFATIILEEIQDDEF